MILVKVIVYWLLGVAALYDDGVAGLAETAGLLALDVAPRRLEVLTTTAGLGLAFTTTVRVVDGVHRHTAHGGTNAHPAGAAGLAGHFVHVLGIANLTDGAVAILIETADFAGGHLDQRIACFTVGNNGLLAGCTGNLAAGTRTDFNVVNGGTQGNVLQGHRIADLGSNLLAAFHLHAHLEARRSQDVGLFTVLVFDQGDAAGAVGIVFDGKHGGRARQTCCA